MNKQVMDKKFEIMMEFAFLIKEKDEWSTSQIEARAMYDLNRIINTIDSNREEIFPILREFVNYSETSEDEDKRLGELYEMVDNIGNECNHK